MEYPGLVPSTDMDAHKHHVTPVPGDLMPSFTDFLKLLHACGAHVCMRTHTDTDTVTNELTKYLKQKMKTSRHLSELLITHLGQSSK